MVQQIDLDTLIALFNVKQIPAQLVYDGNGQRSYVLIPLDARLINFCDIKVTSVSIQGVGTYTSGLTIATYPNVVRIGVSAIGTTNYAGRLAYVVLGINKNHNQ